MRMRKKPNLDARLEKCAELLEENGQTLRGHWRDHFAGYRTLAVELGCGKGRFTADCAEASADTLLVAIERDPSALVMAMELARGRGIGNIRFVLGDVTMLGELFAPGEVGRIYLNFPDPWPKSRDAKLRLTAPNYEAKFIEQGLKINRLVAVRTERAKTLADGEVPRLRNASLCDARGYEESCETHAKREEKL